MVNWNDTLFIIPARGGSKGIPGKNIKPLNGKPLLHYAIDAARAIVPAEQICISTDDPAIKITAEQYGLPVPFLRPAELATDQSGTYEVLLHAIDFYKQHINRCFETIVLLQPTSPFRTTKHIMEAAGLYDSSCDMVVSVMESDSNPYYNLFEEDTFGHLRKVKESEFTRRQDCPPVYSYNGAVYVINNMSLQQQPLHRFTRNRKYVMSRIASVDLDSPLDWQWAEFLMERKITE